jgi:3',5'-cyclic AMP phosphodiesterase CpdA
VSFALAHFSDLHLGPLPAGAAFHAFRAKRVLGALSWHLRRKKLHRADIAEALLQDIHTQAPDHVAFTGDAANVASPLEFPRLRQWMDRLGTPDWLSYTPGNHDAYVKVPYEQGLKVFEPFMTSDMRSDDMFPFVRLRRNVALIGLNSAIPRPFHSAQGRLGQPQRERLRQRLAELRGKGFYRVVMIHHPPAPGLATKYRSLMDAAALKDILCEQQAELVIYGHNHRRELHWLQDGETRLPAIAVPSATMSEANHHPSEWNCYEISRVGGHWQTQVKIRRWNGAVKKFEHAETYVLEPSA